MGVKIIQTWCNFKDWTHGNLFEVIFSESHHKCRYFRVSDVDKHARACCTIYKSASRVFFETTLIGRRHGAGPVNSVSFIWNDNLREKREANANAT